MQYFLKKVNGDASYQVYYEPAKQVFLSDLRNPDFKDTRMNLVSGQEVYYYVNEEQYVYCIIEEFIHIARIRTSFEFQKCYLNRYVEATVEQEDYHDDVPDEHEPALRHDHTLAVSLLLLLLGF